MEAASTAPSERDLFKFVAGGALYVGSGAGLEGLINRSTQGLKASPKPYQEFGLLKPFEIRLSQVLSVR
ncbi:hypothetical protein AYO48_01350 [Gaiella sp. SCGC AG-212-M14]|nr:hypothetical protein AYO48_01350 [Gaiella sp. SCGC AG-212-M14]